MILTLVTIGIDDLLRAQGNFSASSASPAVMPMMEERGVLREAAVMALITAGALVLVIASEASINLSQKTNVEAEVILRNFMQVRLLERISISYYKHNFIPKGGMLIAAMVGIDTHTTMEMDATITGQALMAGKQTPQ